MKFTKQQHVVHRNIVRRVKDGVLETVKPATKQTIVYDVEIDWNDVRVLAERANTNKSSKAKQGPVTVKILSRGPKTETAAW